MSFLFFKSKDDKKTKVNFTDSNQDLHNPYKGKTGSGYLSEEKMMQFALEIADYFIDDDEKNAKSLQRFETIKTNTECIFARKAKLWGCHDYDHTVPLGIQGNRLHLYMFYFCYQMTV